MQVSSSAEDNRAKFSPLSNASSIAEYGSYLTKTDPSVVSQRSFNDWRALTAQLLSDATQFSSQEERIRYQSEFAAQQVMSLVHSWTEVSKAQELGSQLASIFQEASLFAKFLRQQRALWTLRLPTMVSRTGPLMFNAGCMKDDLVSDDEDDERINGAALRQRGVLLVISPTLYKRGTMDGTKFDSERAVVPARVVLAGARM
jgi:hypothetical protein